MSSHVPIGGAESSAANPRIFCSRRQDRIFACNSINKSVHPTRSQDINMTWLSGGVCVWGVFKTKTCSVAREQNQIFTLMTIYFLICIMHRN